jgi:hypothetical protein
MANLQQISKIFGRFIGGTLVQASFGLQKIIQVGGAK